MLYISIHYQIYKDSWQKFTESEQQSQMVNM